MEQMKGFEEALPKAHDKLLDCNRSQAWLRKEGVWAGQGGVTAGL